MVGSLGQLFSGLIFGNFLTNLFPLTTNLYP